MAARDSAKGAQVVLALSVLGLLSSGVVSVLLAVTDSVLWPLMPGVGWPVVAAVVTAMASTTEPSRPGARLTQPALAGEAAPVRRG
jgi:hypothetical protein